MTQKHLRAGAISMGSFVLTQGIRFAGNLFLAKLLAPEAFGLAGIVNMAILGITLMSDLGLRQVVVQRQGQLEASFLNTVWTVAVLRGLGIWGLALLGALGLLLLQSNGLVVGNVYANPLLPYLMVGAASSAILGGLESTKGMTAQRAMSLGRLTAMSLASQLLAMAVMLGIARVTGSPWALIAGAVTAAALNCLSGHVFLPGLRNRFHWDKAIVKTILEKSKWILLSTPLAFLQSSADVMILGGLVNATLLGNYTVAFMLANVVQQVASNLSGNIFFPGMSAAAREGLEPLQKTYLRFQRVSDAIILTVAGGLIAAGPSIVGLLFDKRYAHSGEILSCLAIGLIGLRYHVIESLIQAQGNFKLGSLMSSLRLCALVLGTYLGYYLSGLSGAALGVGLSWFAAWPVQLWYRNKTMAWPWPVEAAALGFLLTGYGLGLVFTRLAVYLPCLHCQA